MRIFRKQKPDDARLDLDKSYARVDTGTAKNGSMVTHRYSLLWYNVTCIDKNLMVGHKKRKEEQYDTRHRIFIPALGADIP